jgi:predicted DNA repair protein MutK
MMKQLLQALEATPWGTAVRENTWLFPTIESIHVLALVLVVGSIMVVDLRLLNLASRQRSVKELTDDVLPWTWSAFALAAITGTLLFSSSAMRYSGIWQFEAKMIMLILAAINMIIFHIGSFRSVAKWDQVGTRPPLAARVAGGTSLGIWLIIVALGRWIGFA